MPPRPAGHPAAHLPAYDDDGSLNVVVDTPRGSRSKFKYDERRGLFVLAHVLAAGAVFPHDFGFVPSTRAEDGDALDVLVLLDDAAFVGCVVPARPIGVIEAEQRDEGDDAAAPERNDRLIAVAEAAHAHRGARTLDDLGDDLLGEIEHFFVSYNAARGRRFTPLGRGGPERAREVVREGERRHHEDAASGRGGG